MADQGADLGRRRFLTATTAVVGGLGGIAAAVPFIKAWLPSERAKLLGAPVTVDVSKLEPGARLIAMWRGSPVWIVRRTKAMLDTLAPMKARLKDPELKNEEQQPDYAKNDSRAIKEEFLVLIGVCTHLGCSPLFQPELKPQPFSADWQGGFFCPCHNSQFDLAGRVINGSPAPDNLIVPPYRYIDDNRIEIGVDPQKGAA